MIVKEIQFTELVGIAGDFVRPVLRRERNTILHWWYAPDSYDTWVTDLHIDMDVDDKYDPDGAWEVG